MTTRKTTPLDGNLVRKGEAVPAAATMPVTVSDIPHGTKGTIAVTVRLDPTLYQELIAFKARFPRRMKNQDILVNALRAYLAQAEE